LPPMSWRFAGWLLCVVISVALAAPASRPRIYSCLGACRRRRRLQSIAQFGRPTRQPLDQPRLIGRFVSLDLLANIFGTVLQQPIYALGQLPRRRHHRLRRAGILDLSSLCQPALEILQVDLIGRSVAGFGGFEAAFLLQPFFLKRLTTPKEKTDAFLQLAVPDNGVAIQKPHRVGVPYFVFRLWQSLVDLPSQKITDVPILQSKRLIILKGVRVHEYCPSAATRLFLPGLNPAMIIEQRLIATLSSASQGAPPRVCLPPDSWPRPVLHYNVLELWTSIFQSIAQAMAELCGHFTARRLPLSATSRREL